MRCRSHPVWTPTCRSKDRPSGEMSAPVERPGVSTSFSGAEAPPIDWAQTAPLEPSPTAEYTTRLPSRVHSTEVTLSAVVRRDNVPVSRS